MPTSWTERTGTTATWTSRAVSSEALLYDSSELYDNDYFYDGTNGLTDASWSTRTPPSSPSWSTRTTP